MPEVTLVADVGRPTGSRAARRLRRAGGIPGVVYGHGADPLPVSVAGRELRVALSGQAGTNTLLSLKAGGKTYLTVARELQHDPVRGTVSHVDFQIVRRDEVIGADVPVAMVGEALEVQHGDGLVEQQLFTVPVRALPAEIPSSIEVDVSTLTIGGAIRVAELALPKGVSVELDPEVPVVVGQPPRVHVVEAAPEGEAAAGEGAGAGERAEAAVPSAGDDTGGGS